MTFVIFALPTNLIEVFMMKFYFQILRQRTGASPETFRLRLNSLVATASFLFIYKTFDNANEQKSIRIHGCGNPNSSGDHETRGESELLQGIIPAKFSF